jgi:hypothetical protein
MIRVWMGIVEGGVANQVVVTASSNHRQPLCGYGLTIA